MSMIKIIVMFMSRLMNNERLIQRLSESYPIRRAAQLFVYFYTKKKPSELGFQNLGQLNGLNIIEKLKKIAEDLEKKRRM